MSLRSECPRADYFHAGCLCASMDVDIKLLHASFGIPLGIDSGFPWIWGCLNSIFYYQTKIKPIIF
jgi:hypothetical protein